MEQSGCTIRLPVFEGPFDLLFHLITRAEVDIWLVSIAEITDQYLDYLQSMRELNLDLASEFLVMAATLLRLKSKMLLPLPSREEEEEEELFAFSSPEELFSRLEEYRSFKAVAEQLKAKEADQQKIFLRSTSGKKVLVSDRRQQSYYTLWGGVQALQEIMQRHREQAAAISSAPYLPSEKYSLREKIGLVLRRLRHREGPVTFRALIAENGELIYTFIALLELVRRQKIALFQDRLFGTILIYAGRKREENGNGSNKSESAN
ncbi:MAG: segregation/condensation protein A [Firmicutes bacterium]|nr:segregation/condensation protein A [Bacillota bacterium]